MDVAEYARTYRIESGHWWFVGLHELILENLPRPPAGGSLRILDAGCGTGGLLERMSGYGRCEGLDASREALEFCEKRGLAGLRYVDLNLWQPTEQTYDVITSVDVLYHRNIRDESRVVAEYHRALKTGGRLIVHEPAFAALSRVHDERVMGRKRFTKSELVCLVESAGFAVRRATYRLPGLFLAIALGKLLRRSAGETSDLSAPPGWLNAIGLAGVRFENLLIGWGLPLYPGSSVFLVADKP